jgi:PilZ domain
MLSEASELRAHKRVSLWGRIVLVWKDGSEVRSMPALARNVSTGGALVQSYRKLPVGSFVRLRSNKLFFISGCARVQHCARRGLTYQIGLKFFNDLSARF